MPLPTIFMLVPRTRNNLGSKIFLLHRNKTYNLDTTSKCLVNPQGEEAWGGREREQST